MTLKWYLLFLIPTWGLTTFASTFVGNGGNAGDIELHVALQQIRATAQGIIKDQNDPELKLCTCYESYQGKPVCQQLKALNEEQIRFCSQTLSTSAKEIQRWTQDTSPVRFTWTEESIQVREGSSLRAVDAVTDSESLTITLNKQNFLSMKPSERVFLLSHELFHLVQYKEKYFKDDVSYPNFPSADGGRQLLNAMASSMVIESYDYAPTGRYDSVLQRSQSFKKHWISAMIEGRGAKSTNSSTYEFTTLAGFDVTYRYQMNSWGLVASVSRDEGQKNILSSTKVKETRTLWGLGVAYRYFPFIEPMTSLGQSHFIFALKLEQLSGSYSAEDSYVSLKDTSSSTGAGASVEYALPFSNDFWGFVRLSYSSASPQYDSFNLRYNSSQGALGLGVTYAF